MRIPLGVFAVAFSTILLPHFSRVSAYAPKRLSFYLLESLKMIAWVTIPAALLMGFFSYEIFYTTYYGKNFTLYDVQQVSSLLQAFLYGLIFFSINKILVNIYYAFHSTIIPTVISIIATVVNIGLNFLLMRHFAAWGLVMATSISAGLQMILFLLVLHYYFNFKLYIKPFFIFLKKYTVQLIVVMGLFCGIYYTIIKAIQLYMPDYEQFLLKSFWVWLWIAPLCGLTLIALYATRKLFGIKLHFLK
jgi:putative peptidoglycan lipid II flippase